MQYRYDELKATQASAYLIQKYPDGILNYMKLIKMLYIANRISLKEARIPLVPDAYTSMPHGPVLSNVLDQINNPSEYSYWDAHIEMARPYEVRVKLDPGTGKLSRRSIRILDQVDAEWHHKSQFQIRDWTHDRNNIPEWKDPHGSSHPIKVEEIFQWLGLQPQEIEEIVEEDSIYKKEETAFIVANRERDNVFCECE